MAEWKTDTEEVKKVVEKCRELKEPCKKKNAVHLSKTLIVTREKSC